MCGRFTMFSSKEEIEDRYQVKLDFPIKPRYNIAPTQLVLGMIQDEAGERKAKFFRWGLIPFWAKDPSIGSKLINARAETIDEKPSFRHLIKRKRCVVISTGFFEWVKKGKKKQPYFIRLKNQQAFSLAGLYDVWQKDDQSVETCTLITTTANGLMNKIHHRMPVIFDSIQTEAWLDQNATETAWLKSMLVPFEEEQMELFPVSTVVNHPRNDSPNTIQPMKQIGIEERRNHE